MRRNRLFEVQIILEILDIKQTTLNAYLNPLEKAGYIKRHSGNHRLLSRSYRLLKDTGIKSPSYKKQMLHDHNTGKKHDLSNIQLNS